MEVFLTWWTLGGQEGGLSPMEAAEMPASMRKDFLSIIGRIGEQRKEARARRRSRERVRKAAKETFNKPRIRRRRR